MKFDFQVGSKIKVIDKKSPYYKWRGSITEELTQSSLFMPNQYDIIGFICTIHQYCLTDTKNIKIEFKPDQIACIQKKFIDIEHIRENDIDLGNGIIRKNNISAFEIGDKIQISEKIDGSNASVAWNEDEGRLEVFSRTNILDGADGLRGFKAYVETRLDADGFKDFPDLVVFGEWCVSHKCRYEKSWYNVWRVYDIWSKSARNYMPQEFVKDFCRTHGLEYIHVLYEGPFVSWDHCRSFMGAKTYGGIEQEGIVVKNQTKLSREDIRLPKYLKIVNEAFKESMAKREKKEIDPETKREMDEAKTLIASVVTEARVNKAILRLIDEGAVPAELTPQCMGAVMKRLPKAVFEDILKEEPETVKAAGAYAGKFCSALTAEFARKTIVGS